MSEYFTNIQKAEDTWTVLFLLEERDDIRNEIAQHYCGENYAEELRYRLNEIDDLLEIYGYLK